VHLVLLEAAGNQAYIFDSNRLTENVGASELTYRAGTEHVLAAVAQVTGRDSLWHENAERLASNLCDPRRNPPIEDGADLEVMLATSGKALLLARTAELAVSVVQATELSVAQDAPGLDLSGAVSAPWTWGRGELARAVDDIHHTLGQVRSALPGPEGRFLRLPVVRDCPVSGLPAEHWVRLRQEAEAISECSWAKREAAQGALRRLRAAFATATRLPGDVRELDAALESAEERWVAVVHADGNGLGAVFQGFAAHAGGAGFTGDRGLVDSYRRFSLALDRCTRHAFRRALAVLPASSGRDFPLLPLVLGGDDLTVLCAGTHGLALTTAYLRAFEAAPGEVPDGEVVGRILEEATGQARPSACAGVAIVKAHHPFHAAYQLAEELLRSAKGVNTPRRAPAPVSAVDFHVLHDASLSRLEDLRAHLRPAGMGTRLYGRPYVVSDPGDGAWAQAHHWGRLDRALGALRAKVSGGRARLLPASQTHALRRGLFLGKDEADAMLHLIADRYPPEAIAALQADPEHGSLFRKEEIAGEAVWVTHLLDALELDGMGASREEGL
jgi:hypothetical protein